MVFMRTGAAGVLVLLTACTVGPDSMDTGLGTTTGEPPATSNITATTIPLPADSGTEDDGGDTTGAATEGGGGSTSSGGAPGTDSGSTGPGGGETSTGEPGGSTDDGPVGTTYDVSWCRLQFPPMADVAVSEAFTVYVRFYAAGLTDVSDGNDPAPELVVEMGYGVDGSDPSTGMGAPWTWVPAAPNVGWNGPAAGEDDNDEYQGDLSIDVAGIYDYAARISGNSGMDWVYCDLDDLLTGGYTPDQAGHAEVGQ